MTEEMALEDWARKVSHALGDGGLDLLINNAGILIPRSRPSGESLTSMCSARFRLSMPTRPH
jgi:hypothetical protein